MPRSQPGVRTSQLSCQPLRPSQRGDGAANHSQIVIWQLGSPRRRGRPGCMCGQGPRPWFAAIGGCYEAASACNTCSGSDVCVVTGLIAAAGTASAADTSPPTQPGAITVSSLTATSGTLSWAKSADDVDVVGYRVYRGPASAADAELRLIASIDVVVLCDALVQRHCIQVRHPGNRCGKQQICHADGHTDHAEQLGQHAASCTHGSDGLGVLRRPY
jgi:hypothetical protein